MEIMFDDLIYEAQVRLLAESHVTSPKEMNWDTIPVAVVEFGDDSSGPEEDDFIDDLYDDCFGPLY